MNERYELNKKHSENPQVGDVWREMFVPYFMVIGVTDKYVIVLDKTKPVDRDHYTFDEDKPKLMTLDELKNAVTYSTMRDKFVADVSVSQGN